MVGSSGRAVSYERGNPVNDEALSDEAASARASRSEAGLYRARVFRSHPDAPRVPECGPSFHQEVVFSSSFQQQGFLEPILASPGHF